MSIERLRHEKELREARREAVRDAARVVRDMLAYNDQRAVSWHEVQDCAEVIETMFDAKPPETKREPSAPAEAKCDECDGVDIPAGAVPCPACGRRRASTAEAKCATCGGEREVVYCACGCGLTERAAIREAMQAPAALNEEQAGAIMKTEKRPCPDCGGSGVRR